MPRILGLILILPVAELIAFVLVASAIGFGKAILLQLGISLIGFAMLGSLLSEARVRARSGGGLMSIALDKSHSLRGLAGLLFTIPGFITDALGVLALVPEVRERLRRLIGGAEPMRQRRPQPDTARGRAEMLDLDRQEWREVQPSGRREA